MDFHFYDFGVDLAFVIWVIQIATFDSPWTLMILVVIVVIWRVFLVIWFGFVNLFMDLSLFGIDFHSCWDRLRCWSSAPSDLPPEGLRPPGPAEVWPDYATI